MPLEIIWTCILVAISIAFAIGFGRSGDLDFQFKMIVGMNTSGGLAIAVSWDMIFSRLATWLDSALPQAGTDIHHGTMAILVAAACLGAFLSITLLPALLVPERARERSCEYGSMVRGESL